MNLIPYAEGEKRIECSQVCWVADKSLQKKQHMDEKHQQVVFASDCPFEDEPTENKTKQQSHKNNWIFIENQSPLQALKFIKHLFVWTAFVEVSCDLLSPPEVPRVPNDEKSLCHWE